MTRAFTLTKEFVLHDGEDEQKTEELHTFLSPLRGRQSRHHDLDAASESRRCHRD
jgi:hypothetical protein